VRDDEVIDAFVEHLRMTGRPVFTVDRRPDKLDRSAPAIDAIAGQFAIEHTSLEALPDQRRNDAWYERVVGPLEREFGDKLPYGLVVSVPYGAVTAGQDWNGIRSVLRKWVRDNSGRLPDGRHVVERPCGADLCLHVWKRSRRRGVFFKRQLPSERISVTSVRNLLLRKANKLAECDEGIETRLLLVENGDIALMNPQALTGMLQAAFPEGRPAGVDELWFADTSISDALEFRNLTVRIWPARNRS
jgi:hypothetical protein